MSALRITNRSDFFTSVKISFISILSMLVLIRYFIIIVNLALSQINIIHSFIHSFTEGGGSLCISLWGLGTTRSLLAKTNPQNKVSHKHSIFLAVFPLV